MRANSPTDPFPDVTAVPGSRRHLVRRTRKRNTTQRRVTTKPEGILGQQHVTRIPCPGGNGWKQYLDRDTRCLVQSAGGRMWDKAPNARASLRAHGSRQATLRVIGVIGAGVTRGCIMCLISDHSGHSGLPEDPGLTL